MCPPPKKTNVSDVSELGSLLLYKKVQKMHYVLTFGICCFVRLGAEAGTARADTEILSSSWP
jgi:hypothetical protein